MRCAREPQRLLAAILAAFWQSAGVQGRCDLQKVSGSRLSSEEFGSKYWERVPVVITDLISEWPALKEERWTMQALVDSYGSQSFDSSYISGNSRKGESFRDGSSLRSFLAGGREGNHSWFLEPHAPLLRDMLRKGDFFVPAALGVVHREGPFLSLARKGQWNPFHNHENSWFAQVVGAKKWFVLPPGQPSRAAVKLGDAALDICSSGGLKALTRCDLQAGQVLYLPSRFTHGTCALAEPSVGLAFIGSPGSGATGAAAGGGRPPAARDVQLLLAAKMGSLTQAEFRAAGSKLRRELLRTAAASDHARLVGELCKQGARCGGAGATSVLAAAVEAGAEGVVERLAAAAGVRWQAATGGQSLLHLAAAEGHVGLAELLLRHGLDPSAPDAGPMRNGPAFLAAWHGHLGVLKLLIAKGASPRQLNAEGLGLWHLAALESYFYVIEYLHGLVHFDLEEFMRWSQQVEAPVALTNFIDALIRKQKRRRKEL